MDQRGMKAQLEWVGGVGGKKKSEYRQIFKFTIKEINDVFPIGSS